MTRCQTWSPCLCCITAFLRNVSLDIIRSEKYVSNLRAARRNSTIKSSLIHAQIKHNQEAIYIEEKRRQPHKTSAVYFGRWRVTKNHRHNLTMAFPSISENVAITAQRHEFNCLYWWSLLIQEVSSIKATGSIGKEIASIEQIREGRVSRLFILVALVSILDATTW